ncbi:NUDIX hydrolase [Arthrobacter psychrochitiniphilus]|uniref:NUDIX hydrolase n=1 Tax=Arthrobacter psychrochitiniphilus TaxID=291045 RepID=UPI003F7BC7AB
MVDHQSQRTEVWASAGKPKIQVLTQKVQHNGRHWLQHIVQADEGTVGAVALTRFEEKFLLVEHFRPVTGQTLLEFPRGFGNDPHPALGMDEQACADGVRELREETGITHERATVLGYIWADSGLLGNRIAIVVIQAAADHPDSPLDGEIDSQHWLTEAELAAAITSGRVCDGITLAAYALWCAKVHRIATAAPNGWAGKIMR